MPKHYITHPFFDSVLPKLVCEQIWQVINHGKIPLGKLPGQEEPIACLIP